VNAFASLVAPRDEAIGIIRQIDSTPRSRAALLVS
jgi:hypothetical protein